MPACTPCLHPLQPTLSLVGLQAAHSLQRQVRICKRPTANQQKWHLRPGVGGVGGWVVHLSWACTGPWDLSATAVLAIHATARCPLHPP